MALGAPFEPQRAPGRAPGSMPGPLSRGLPRVAATLAGGVSSARSQGGPRPRTQRPREQRARPLPSSTCHPRGRAPLPCRRTRTSIESTAAATPVESVDPCALRWHGSLTRGSPSRQCTALGVLRDTWVDYGAFLRRHSGSTLEKCEDTAWSSREPKSNVECCFPASSMPTTIYLVQLGNFDPQARIAPSPTRGGKRAVLHTWKGCSAERTFGGE